MSADLSSFAEDLGRAAANSMANLILDNLCLQMGPVIFPEVKAPMLPKEKLHRLLHPTCAADYGIGIPLEELETFPEGQEFVRDFFERYVP